MTSLLVLLQNVANWMKEWGVQQQDPPLLCRLVLVLAFVVQSSSLKDPTYMRFISLPWFFLAG